MKPNRNQGFSIIELLITLAVFTVIMIGVYSMIIHYAGVTKTEHSRTRMTQESRFFLSTFASEIKNIGSTLTLSHTGNFLKSDPYFNGIYPLNSTTYPDGIIIATGDPYCVSALNADWDPESGKTLNVEKTSNLKGETLWQDGDIGIVLGPTKVKKDGTDCTGGYYVFRVKDAGIKPNSIEMTNVGVYYSGQIHDTHYRDFVSNSSGVTVKKGNETLYPKGSPVVRLTSFSIYAFRESATENRREFLRITDTAGDPAPITNLVTDGSDSSLIQGSIISENIYDMQISYVVYLNAVTNNPSDQTIYFKKGEEQNFESLYNNIRQRKLKQVELNIVALTDTYSGKGTLNLEVPTIGDRDKYKLNLGKMNYRLLTINLSLRNFSIAI